MFEQFEKVKYVGHIDGCVSCDRLPVDGPWAKRVGRVATFLGEADRQNGTVKVHFDGEDFPCFAYLAHLDKARAR